MLKHLPLSCLSILIFIQIITNAQEIDTLKNKTFRLSHVGFTGIADINQINYKRFVTSISFKIKEKSAIAPIFEYGIEVPDYAYNTTNYPKYYGFGFNIDYYLQETSTTPYIKFQFLKKKNTITYYSYGDIFDPYSTTKPYEFWGEKIMLFIGYSYIFGNSDLAIDINYGIGCDQIRKIVEHNYYQYTYQPVFTWEKDYLIVKYLSIGMSYYFNTRKHN